MSSNNYAAFVRAPGFRLKTVDAFGRSIEVDLVEELRKQRKEIVALQNRIHRLEHPELEKYRSDGKKRWWQ